VNMHLVPVFAIVTPIWIPCHRVIQIMESMKCQQAQRER
jgi:hypothetical protein